MSWQGDALRKGYKILATWHAIDLLDEASAVG